MRKLFTALAAAGLLFAASPSTHAAFDYKLSPEQGKVESLKTITLTYSGTKPLFAPDVLIKNSMTVTKDDVQVATGSVVDEGDDSFVYTLNNELTEEGTYIVTIEEGAMSFVFSADWSDYEDSPEITLTYTIGDVAAPELVEINWMGFPSDNSTEETMPDGSIQILLSQEGEEFTESDTLKPTITWNGEDASAWFTTELDFDTYYIYPEASEASNYEGNGKFEATFPDGYFLLDGKEVKGFTYSFNVESEPEEPTLVELNWRAIPANNATVPTFPDDNISFMLADGITVTSDMKLRPTFLWNDEDASGWLTYYLDDPTYLILPESDEMSNFEGNGKFVVTFPDGYFLLDGKEVKGFTYTLNVGTAEEEKPIWTANPENGGSITTTQNEAPSFVLTFPEDTTLEVDAVDGWKAMWNTTDITQYLIVVDRNNTVTFSIPSSNLAQAGISGEGVYTFTIPTGFIKANGENVAGFTYVVNVVVPSQQVIKFNDNVTSITPSAVTPLVSAPAGTFTNVVIEMKEAVELADNAAEFVFASSDSETEIIIKATDIVFSADGKNVEIPVTEDALAQGNYKLTLPEGLFSLANGDILSETTISFTVGWGTFAPTEVDLNSIGTYVTKDGWNKIVFTPFGAVQNNDPISNDSGVVSYPGCTEPALLTNEAGKTVESFDATKLSLFKSVIEMTITNAVDAPGVYTLSFPAGFWRVGEGEPTEEALSPAFSVDFTVTGMVQTYTTTPDETGFDVFPTVTVTFDGATGLTVPEGAQANLYKGIDRKTSLLTFDLSAVDGKLVITPTEDYTTYAGAVTTKLVIVIPSGTFSIDYNGNVVPNNEVSIDKYKINAPVPVITSVTSVSPAVITTMSGITFSTNGTVAANAIKSAKLYKVVDGVKDGTAVLTYKMTITEDKTGFTLTYKDGQEEVEKGDYCVELPAGYVYVTIDGARISSLAADFFYTLGEDTNVGLAGINAENGLVDVYTMTGVCVMRQASVEALNGLAPGLYIINGKKVMVK